MEKPKKKKIRIQIRQGYGCVNHIFYNYWPLTTRHKNEAKRNKRVVESPIPSTKHMSTWCMTPLYSH